MLVSLVRRISSLPDLPTLKPVFLTKSRYKLALECPRKVYLSADPSAPLENDPFMLELAKGGFQVGALAQKYDELSNSNIVNLAEERDSLKAVERTKQLLSQEEIVIFEAAFLYEGCLVRVDILRKKGNEVKLLEVKAKSFNSQEGAKSFWNVSADTILANWAPYLFDVAFQTWAVHRAFPALNLHPHLVMPDKAKKSTVAGLNQLFRAHNEGGSTKWRVTSPALQREDLGDSILCEQDVTKEVEFLHECNNHRPRSFEEEVLEWSICNSGLRASEWSPHRSPKCKSCEFRGIPQGLARCYAEAGVPEKDLNEPLVFDVWNFRSASKLMAEGIFSMKDIKETMVRPKAKKKDLGTGLAAWQRQLLQVNRYQKQDPTPYFDKEGFKAELYKVRFPLHFIDFETTRTALPFFKGHGPYQQIAFQFSHHQMEEDGSIAHKGQFLSTGADPTLDFLKNLYFNLGQDKGSVFRYASHENSVLLDLVSRYDVTPQIRAFVESLTVNEESEGQRAMVDMLAWVKRYYYSPLTKGSNSLKAVFPAILKESAFLQNKYSKPIYGGDSAEVIPSLNLDSAVAWVQKDEQGNIRDPYSLLPKLNIELDQFNDDDVANGGAAMAAWGALQFVDMPDSARNELSSALLRYCELDTLAMCMLWERFSELVK